MDLSIILVNWNTRDLLAQCLQSVYDTVQGLEFEVFVVDNASSDGSAAMVRECFPQVRLIENEENRGFARANNQGLRSSKGRFVLLLNSDTRLLSDAVNRMVAFIDTNASVGVLGCQLLNSDGSLQPSWADFPTLASAILGRDFRRHVRPYAYTNESDEEAIEVDAVSGACMMAPREAIQAVGLLDEDYLLYCEEVDWCYRIRQAGWMVCYLPQVHVVHHLGKSRARIQSYAYQQLHRSRLLFFCKHYGLWKTRLLRLGMQVALLGKLIVTYGSSVLRSASTEEISQKLENQTELWRWLSKVDPVCMSNEDSI